MSCRVVALRIQVKICGVLIELFEFFQRGKIIGYILQKISFLRVISYHVYYRYGQRHTTFSVEQYHFSFLILYQLPSINGAIVDNHRKPALTSRAFNGEYQISDLGFLIQAILEQMSTSSISQGNGFS